MNYHRYVAELNGYLRALQRICGGSYVFGATHFLQKYDIEKDTKNFVNIWGKENGTSYVSLECIDYDEIIANIESIIIDNILKRKKYSSKKVGMYIPRTILEDIQEYFGLISTSINKNGIFHPLIKSPKFKLIVKNPSFHKSLFFLVEIENVLVLTYLYKKTHPPLSS